MQLSIPALPFKQRGIQMYLAAFPLYALTRCVVDTWKPNTILGERGYQRQADEARFKRIAKFFERNDSIMPVAGLLNIRQKGKIEFKDGVLTIKDNVEIWVVDMQHRMRGLIDAHENDLFEGQEFSYPVVITEGLNALHEAAQFYLINTKSKKMDVALTRRILIENDEVNAVADVPEWELLAVRTTIELNARVAGPWRGAIQPPNSTRDPEAHLVTEKSFVPSLKPFFVGGKCRQPKKLAKRLGKYWEAIEKIFPEAFDDPKRFLIQKTPGLFVFNFFIGPRFLNKYKNDKQFASKLAGLEKLGSEFWRRKNKGGAKKFGTGMGGYALLASEISKHISI